jgi:hypothetical protein
MVAFIKNLVKNALLDANTEVKSAKNKQELHRNRSKYFVEFLGEQLRLGLSDKGPLVRVLTKHNSDNRTDFGLNELLFDVMVCEIATVKSARGTKPLIYISKGLWAVESEMAKNSREAIYDFNKLCLSSCENQLFVGPLTSDNNAFLEPLRKVAQACQGNVYVALIPHPSEWDSKSFSPDSVVVEWLNG